jgi:nuclear respiratory factor 1
MRNCKGVIIQDLEGALAQQAPPAQAENPALHELPPLNIDGIPTPVDKMTQVIYTRITLASLHSCLT